MSKYMRKGGGGKRGGGKRGARPYRGAALQDFYFFLRFLLGTIRLACLVAKGCFEPSSTVAKAAVSILRLK